METFTPNDKANYYSGITSITVNGKNAYELKGKFLDDLHNNAFSGTNGKDAIEHIEYYLKIIDPIKLPNVDHDKLRIVVFPISLVGGAQRSFDRTKESITCWVDLTTNLKLVSTTIEADSYPIRQKKGSYGPQFSEAYSEAAHINNSIPIKEKDPRSFTLPCFINTVCFDNALVDLGASVSVMPLSTLLY
ncbi:hypothetical protein Tco_1505125 [Tanacetum coccineum]